MARTKAKTPDGGDRTINLNVRLTPGEHDQLHEVAADRGQNASAMLREWISLHHRLRFGPSEAAKGARR